MLRAIVSKLWLPLSITEKMDRKNKNQIFTAEGIEEAEERIIYSSKLLYLILILFLYRVTSFPEYSSYG